MLALAPALARTKAPLLVACALALLAGCHFTVVQPVNPNDPLYNARNFVLEPLSFPNLLVGGTPEPAYLARKDPNQQRSWEVDKAEAARFFYDQAMTAARGRGLNFMPPPPPGPGFFILRPIVNYIEPGVYTFVFNKDTEVRGTIQILNEQGQVLDESPFGARVRATAGNPSSGGRLRVAGTELGMHLVNRVLRRTGARY